MNQLFLCRHGKTEWNAEHRIQGRTDIPLSDNGHEQARALARFIAAQNPDIEYIVSSPLMRARETAEHISEKLAIPVTVDDDITEIDTGIYTARTMDELKDDPLWQKHLADPWYEGYGPCGETAAHVRKRIIRAINSYNNAIFITHAGPIRHAIMYLLDIPPKHLYHLCIGNASASRFERHDGFDKLIYFNIVPQYLSNDSAASSG